MIRLSWNEVRARAAVFAQEWEGKGYEKGETQLFYQELFQVFGMPLRRVASFEEPVKKLGGERGYVDLFWKGMLLVEQKSMGRSLVKAKEQALEYFPGLKDKDLPRYLLLSDFQNFELYDLDEDEESAFPLAELHQHIEKFGFILGMQKRSFKDQDPVNIDAAEQVGQIHDSLLAMGYVGQDLEQFLVRIVFCLFADDTGIFEPRDSFMELLEQRSQEDGSDLGRLLMDLFQVLNTPEDERQSNQDEDLARFPYIDGALFSERLRIPAGDALMRKRLLAACEFDWSQISPAIFGSLFQSVMDPTQRRAQGAHYTTEKNILKVIEPLFLDALRAEFQRLKARKDGGRRSALEAFHRRLWELRFLDPACGCGNFLIIAYRELRLLEIELLRELHSTQQGLDLSQLSQIDVDLFYGIELGAFPARIAETALWMMDHIMNTRLSLEFGQSYVRIPLRKSPQIRCADALELDWSELLPPQQCSYVLGNPPFGGVSYQSAEQNRQMHRVAELGGSKFALDYVICWFVLAGQYIQQSRARIGFVATNSITQGEQAARLWPILLERYKLEIAFAHRTFAWGSEASGKAHVHVVILGLTQAKDAPAEKRLFSYETPRGEPHESRPTAISPYLFDASHLGNAHLVVKEATAPLHGLPRMIRGSPPIDGGHYIFNAAQKDEFLAEEPAAAQYLRPFVGTQEFLHGQKRWILALQDAEPHVLKTLPKVRQRIAAVRAYRLKSKRKKTLVLAATPTLYDSNIVPKEPFLVVPETTSERREYVPIGWLSPPTIPSNAVRLIEHATLPLFGLLTSTMHMTWMRYFGGRLESRYRYSIGLVYNTFPLPPGPPSQLERLAPLAQAILRARAAHPAATLADLYDPNTMPPILRKAHQALDRAVDRLYRRSPFASEYARVEHLLGLYEKLTHPLIPKAPRTPRRRRSGGTL